MIYLLLTVLGFFFIILSIFLLWREKSTSTWPTTKAKLVSKHKRNYLSVADYRVEYYVKGVKYETDAGGVEGGITPFSGTDGAIQPLFKTKSGRFGYFYILHGTTTPTEFDIRYNPDKPHLSSQIHLFFGGLIGKLFLYLLFSIGVYLIITSISYLSDFSNPL